MHGSADIDPDPQQNAINAQHCFLPIPDTVSRSQKGTGSRFRIRNTELITIRIRGPEPFWYPGSGIKNRFFTDLGSLFANP